MKAEPVSRSWEELGGTRWSKTRIEWPEVEYKRRDLVITILEQVALWATNSRSFSRRRTSDFGWLAAIQGDTGRNRNRRGRFDG